VSDGVEVWVGLVELRPLPGNDRLEGDPGAFANALLVAADAIDFRTRAAAFFRGEGFTVESFEDVERLDERAAGRALPERILRLGALARETREVQFDEYFAYRSGDE